MADRYGPPPAQLGSLARAQRVRMLARRAGVVSVARRGRRWQLRFDAAAAPSDSLAEAIGGRPEARLSPRGELSLPAADDGGGLDELLRFLEAVGRDAGRGGAPGPAAERLLP
jgi:transcription-repair coupling factor (superfamily II helicase)